MMPWEKYQSDDQSQGPWRGYAQAKAAEPAQTQQPRQGTLSRISGAVIGGIIQPPIHALASLAQTMTPRGTSMEEMWGKPGTTAGSIPLPPWMGGPIEFKAPASRPEAARHLGGEAIQTGLLVAAPEMKGVPLWKVGGRIGAIYGGGEALANAKDPNEAAADIEQGAIGGMVLGKGTELVGKGLAAAGRTIIDPSRLKPYWFPKSQARAFEHQASEIDVTRAELAQKMNLERQGVRERRDLIRDTKTALVNERRLKQSLGKSAITAATEEHQPLIAESQQRLSSAIEKNVPHLKSQILKESKVMTDIYGNVMDKAIEAKEFPRDDYNASVLNPLLERMQDDGVPEESKIFQTLKNLANPAEEAEAAIKQPSLPSAETSFDNIAIEQFASQTQKASLGEAPTLKSSTTGKQYIAQPSSNVKGNINKVLADVRNQAADALDLSEEQRALLVSDGKKGDAFRKAMAAKLQELTGFDVGHIETANQGSGPVMTANNFRFLRDKVMSTVRQGVKDGKVPPNMSEYWAMQFNKLQTDFIGKYAAETPEYQALLEANKSYRSMAFARQQLFRRTAPKSAPENVEGAINLMEKLASGDLNANDRAAIKLFEEGHGPFPGLGKGAISQPIAGEAMNLQDRQRAYTLVTGKIKRDLQIETQNLTKRIDDLTAERVKNQIAGTSVAKQQETLKKLELARKKLIEQARYEHMISQKERAIGWTALGAAGVGGAYGVVPVAKHFMSMP